MAESLFIPPKAVEGEVLEEALQRVHDNGLLFVIEDVQDDVVLTEDKAIAVLANYGQVRQYLLKGKLGRGYSRPSRLEAKLERAWVNPPRRHSSKKRFSRKPPHHRGYGRSRD